MSGLKENVKWLLFPGTNLNARLRVRVIGSQLGRPNGAGPLSILDAGCGNGALAYEAHLLGNNVLGVSIKDEVERNRRLFNHRLQIPEEKLRFKELNLYDVESLGANQFDEIICTEVMEHISGDSKVCKSFFHILKPGGRLHLCCPNADHPYHRNYPLDPDEKGGHVRPGYTHETYRALLEPIGFQVSSQKGIGGYWRHKGNEWIRSVEKIAGVGGGVLAFFVINPVAWLDRLTTSMPFSLYVQATKPK